MKTYVLIESRDPFECRAVDGNRRLAQSLAEAGDSVVLFLVQNGVLAARRSVQDPHGLGSLPDGITVLCDELSLRERGIQDHELSSRAELASVDAVIERMCQGCQTLWL